MHVLKMHLFPNKSFEIWSDVTLGSLIIISAPFSIRSLTIWIAGDSLVSLVFALKANPRITIFFRATVPKMLDRVGTDFSFLARLFEE